MTTIIDEIAQARGRLGLPPSSMSLVAAEQGESVFLAALGQFVASGNRRWWWEDFRRPAKTVAFEDGQGWKRLPEIAPDPDELVWFIAEDDSLPHYPVFETTPSVASMIIGECHGFEYYLVAKDLSWLLCETHHNVMCAVGEQIEGRLACD